jgi:8-oxo-dGTP diphosphatase
MEVVCAVLFDPTGRILAAQRAPGKPLAGKWEFPGGKIEPSESPEAALQREIREELGCEIELGVALPAVYHAHANSTITLLPFVARLVHGSPVAHEHAALEWVALDSAHALDWAEADRRILAALVAR